MERVFEANSGCNNAGKGNAATSGSGTTELRRPLPNSG